MSYSLGDLYPGRMQERDVDRPANMQSFDYGQTMRYRDSENPERQFSLDHEEAEAEQRSYTFGKPPGMITREAFGEAAFVPRSTEEEWHPWMRHMEVPVSQARVMDLEDFGGEKNKLYEMTQESVIPANENIVYLNDRVDGEDFRERYSNK